MPCDEKISLLLDYQRLTHVHSDAIGQMVQRGLSQSEYEYASADAKKAGQAAINARKRLAQHIVGHGCYVLENK